MIEEMKKRKIDLYVVRDTGMIWDKEDVERRLDVIRERAKRLVEEYYEDLPKYGYAPSTLASASLYISSCVSGYACILKDFALLSEREMSTIRQAHDDILHRIVKRHFFSDSSN